MNVVLVADKKIRKSFENAVKKSSSITLLGVEMVIRGNTISRLTEHHNPHAVVIYRNTPQKEGMTIRDIISFLRLKRPQMRIIYVYGPVKDNEHFYEEHDFLTENKVYDIITDNELTSVINVIDNPMTKEDAEQIILKLEEEKEKIVIDEIQTEEKEKTYDNIFLDFPAVTSLNDFDRERIERNIIKTSQANSAVVIGVAQLQHHNGCTHTSFEIAAMLSKKNKTAVVMTDKDTFENLIVFHKINPQKAENGIEFNGIDVYPFSMLNDIKQNYSAVICDFGFLRECQKPYYGDCNVKIMLCSAAEWDIGLTMKYINFSNESYIHDVNFCFPRVTRTKFIKYNKQFIKSGCNAYKLNYSPDWTCPHQDNFTVYKEILKPYLLQPVKEKNKKKLLRIK